jgi:hypothetical protein
MNKFQIGKIFLLHVVFFVAGTSIFILLFRTPAFCVIDVYFYRGIALLVLACVIIAVSFAFLYRSHICKELTYRDIILSLVLIFCLNLVFFTHVPVTADRSITVFLLSFMSDNQKRIITQDEMNDVFAQTYVLKNRSMEKRIHEQLISGNIMKDSGGYRITPQGQRVMRFYHLVGTLFLSDSKNLIP